MKNFEPARSAAPALGCLRRRSALSNTGILRDGSLWRPRNADRPDSALAAPFRRHPAWLSSARGAPHLASRATARPAGDPAANADSGSVPTPETASGRSYLHENRTTSSRRSIERIIRNCLDGGQTMCRRRPRHRPYVASSREKTPTRRKRSPREQGQTLNAELLHQSDLRPTHCDPSPKETHRPNEDSTFATHQPDEGHRMANPSNLPNDSRTSSIEDSSNGKTSALKYTLTAAH